MRTGLNIIADFSESYPPRERWLRETLPTVAGSVPVARWNADDWPSHSDWRKFNAQPLNLFLLTGSFSKDRSVWRWMRHVPGILVLLTPENPAGSVPIYPHGFDPIAIGIAHDEHWPVPPKSAQCPVLGSARTASGSVWECFLDEAEKFQPFAAAILAARRAASALAEIPVELHALAAGRVAQSALALLPGVRS